MHIVITPFIVDTTGYRLNNIARNVANRDINYAEPYWYANTHPRFLNFMYGGVVGKRPDILDCNDLDCLLEFFDANYHYDTIIHVPFDIHLDPDAIDRVIHTQLFSDYPQITEEHLGFPFIRCNGCYYRLPVTTIDARKPKDHCHQSPLIQFDAKNSVEEINKFLLAQDPKKSETDDEFLAVPVGGWCGVAESLRSLGLRDEAYPFDYIRSDFRPIVDILALESPSRETIESILYDLNDGSRIEFVHHDAKEDATRSTFLNRTFRFIERVSESQQPILFIRAARDDVPLETEIEQSRRLLALTESKFHRPNDRILLIANYKDLPTGKLGKHCDGRMVIWNAMGVNAWKVPNNWHLATNLTKIIRHELDRGTRDSDINFRQNPDYSVIHDVGNGAGPSRAPATEAQVSAHSAARVVIHISGRESLEFHCAETSPIISDLIQALHESETHPERCGTLVYLRLEEDGKPYDILVRGSDILGMEVTPSLKANQPVSADP